MEERDKKTELLVGLFLFIGLLLLGGLTLKFSSLLDHFKHTYEITVPFPDATGVKADTPIILGGSRIGKVPRMPILNEHFNGVIVPLEIYEGKRIPIDAKFNIGTAGLLGDAYIEIRPSGKPTEKYIEPGTQLTSEDTVKGQGLGALQETANKIGKQADVVLIAARDAAAELKDALSRVNKGALSDKTLESFRNSMTHLEATMKNVNEEVLGTDNKANLKQALADLKDATASFKSAATSVDSTMKKLDPLIGKLEPAVDKVDKAMTSADSMMTSFKQAGDNLASVTKDMAKGDGLFKALLIDKQLRDDFKDLISNLKRNGVLFYKNNADKLEAEEQARKEQEKRRPTISPLRSRP